jgi:hypothetical protein
MNAAQRLPRLLGFASSLSTNLQIQFPLLAD